MKLVKIFETISDCRTTTLVTYPLTEILIISLCAVLSGAEDFEEIAEYGCQKRDFLSKFLKLKNGTPSHDTFNKVFRNMETFTFENCLKKWSKITKNMEIWIIRHG